tara:strand:- start:249 stop:803 length:555 start_codon:yes stop_codon:yes gene_type:complete
MALTRLGLNQAVNLATNTTGTLAVANGGTGLSSGFINGTTNVGKVLSINTAQVTDSGTGNNTSFAEYDTDLRVSVTPQSASSKFLIELQTKTRQTATTRFTEVRFYKSVAGGSYAAIENDAAMFTGFNVSLSDSHMNFIAKVIHSPSTTSALIFTPYVKVNSGDWELGSRAAQCQTNMVVMEYE